MQDVHGSELCTPFATGQVLEVPSWQQDQHPTHGLHLLSAGDSAWDWQQANVLSARCVVGGASHTHYM